MITRSRQPKLAARDDDGGAAHFDLLGAFGRSGGARVQHARPRDFGALLDAISSPNAISP
jgi:hypothetical protein